MFVVGIMMRVGIIVMVGIMVAVDNNIVGRDNNGGGG